MIMMIRTVAMSSMTRQPTATCPSGVLSQPRSMKPRSMTMVLAMDSAKPNTKPAMGVQPQNWLSPNPRASMVSICPSVPTMATSRTFHRPAKEKCRPTPNIRKTILNSAS